MNHKEPKVIYLKALFSKNKSKKNVEKIIKEFVVQAEFPRKKLKVSPEVKSKMAREFILKYADDFLGYAVEYSMFDKFFDLKSFDKKI